MLPYFGARFGNALSKSYVFGDQAGRAVENERTLCAESIGAAPKEIFFTSGATEAINLALKGTAEETGFQGLQFISVRTEHKATLDCLCGFQKV